MLDPLSSIHISIVGQRTVKCVSQPCTTPNKPFTAYQLSVYRGAAFCHAVEKRYSDFERLHRQLRSALPRQCRLPDLPTKRFLVGPESDLRRDLDAYLNNLLVCLQQRAAAAGLDAAIAGLVCRFLGVDSDVVNRAGKPTRCQQPAVQHAPVVRIPEVDLVPRAELDLLTYTVIDTVYQSSGSSSIDD